MSARQRSIGAGIAWSAVFVAVQTFMYWPVANRFQTLAFVCGSIYLLLSYFISYPIVAMVFGSILPASAAPRRNLADIVVTVGCSLTGAGFILVALLLG